MVSNGLKLTKILNSYKEEKGNYFKLRDSEEICDRILDAFGVEGENRHIINGHVPVHASKGENPIKAGGRLMVIDGGFSEAYHNETGIAGYTLVYHSRGFQLVQHEPFTSQRDAIVRETDTGPSSLDADVPCEAPSCSYRAPEPRGTFGSTRC